MTSLREAIAEKLAIENGVEADSDRNIMATAGANQAFANAILCLTSPGDRVLVLSPYYFNHVMCIQLADCKPVVVDTDRNYQPLVEKMAEQTTKRIKAVVLVSPNNPTGAVCTRNAIKEIGALCAENDMYLITDETYEHFVYDDAEHVSALAFGRGIDHTISLFSFSKSYGMSGYRIGYAVFPQRIYNEMLKVQDTLTICAPSVLQAAAEAAIKVGSTYPKQFIPRMEKVRKILIERLAHLDSAEMPITNGSYYFLLKLRTKNSDWEIAKKLIEEYGIITIPGEAFGTRYPALRVAYAKLAKTRTTNPLVYKVSDDIMGGGVSVNALITTSHLTVHTSRLYGTAEFDCATCGFTSNPLAALATFRKALRPTHITVQHESGVSRDQIVSAPAIKA
jgi:aspartate/methionine/tyrosine aminotransferase